MSKKLLHFALLLCAVICLCLFCGTTALAADCYTQTELQYTEKGDNLAITVNGTEARAMITLAFYNEGKVVSIVPLLSANGADVNFIIDEDLTFDLVKIFSFDNTSTLAPLGEPEVLDFSEPNVIEVSLRGKDIELAAVDGNRVTLEYWATKEDALPTDMDFNTPEKVFIYYNYAEIGNLADSAEALDYFTNLDSFNCITAVDEDLDGNVDFIEIKEYEYGIIKEIDAINSFISTDYAGYDLSPYNDALISYQIYKDNKRIKLTDLQVGDMLNVIASDLGDEYAYEFHVTNEVITDTITSISQDNDGDYIYTINDKEYYTVEAMNLTPGTTGDFYITIDGLIYDVVIPKEPLNFGFILDVAEDSSGFGSSYQVKMLTKENTIEVFTFASKLNVEMDVDGMYTSAIYKNDSVNRNQAEFFGEDGSISALVAHNANMSTAEDIIIDELFITYKTEGDIIYSISFPSTTTDVSFNIDEMSDVYYNKKFNKIDGKYVTEDTYVFHISPSYDSFDDCWYLDEDTVQVFSIDRLKDEAAYTGYMFAVDRNTKEVGAMVVTGDMPSFASENSLAVFKSLSVGLNAAGENAYLLNVWEGNQFVSYVESDRLDFDIHSLTAGDVIQIDTDVVGDINDILLIYDLAEDYSAGELLMTTGGSDVQYVAGVVTDDFTGGVLLEYDDGYWDPGWNLAEGGTNVVVDITKLDRTPNTAFTHQTDTDYLVKGPTMNGTSFRSFAYIAVAKCNSDGEMENVVAYKYDASGGIAISDMVARVTIAQ